LYKFSTYWIYLSLITSFPSWFVWTGAVFAGGKGGPLMAAGAILSKVGGIIGILQVVLTILAYTSVKKETDVTPSTYETI
jgi:hypothetical protein